MTTLRKGRISNNFMSQGSGSNPSTAVAREQLVDLFDGELVQTDDARRSPVEWRDHGAGLILVLRLHDDPGPVIAVHASKVSLRHEVGSSLEQELHRSRARDLLRLMGNFDQKSLHRHPPQ